jgi:hypothetical protein
MKLAQKLANSSLFIAAFPPECMGQLCIIWANLTHFSLQYTQWYWWNTQTRATTWRMPAAAALASSVNTKKVSQLTEAVEELTVRALRGG